MPIFHDGEKSTFGPTMGVAMSKSRAEKPEDEKDEKHKKVGEHLKKAHEHVKAAMDAHDGSGADEHEEGGSSLMSMLGASEDSES
jgi:hypothetical protein